MEGRRGRREGKGRERPGLYVICCKLSNESVFFFLHIVTDEGILDYILCYGDQRSQSPAISFSFF